MATASSSLSTSPSLPGTTGTPARMACSRAVCFSPRDSIVSAAGPTKVMPFCRRRLGKFGFSDRNPYPGMTASTALSLARLIIWSLEGQG